MGRGPAERGVRRSLQARRGELIDVLALPGFVAERDTRPVGLLTYRREAGACELAFIAAMERHQGIGSALLDALRRVVADWERIWVVTTNDNLEAIRFYQRRGLRPLRSSYRSRRRHIGALFSPRISAVGNFGIPVRDEIELATRSQ